MRSSPRRLAALVAAGLLVPALAVATADTAAEAACSTPSTVAGSPSFPYAAGPVVAVAGGKEPVTAGAGNTTDPAKIAWRPFTFGADVVKRDASGNDVKSRAITMVYQKDFDGGSAANPYQGMLSTDSGATFSNLSFSTDQLKNLGEVGQLNDGRLLAVNFVVQNGAVPGTTGQYYVKLQISGDKGATWSSVPTPSAVLHYPASGYTVGSFLGMSAAGRPIQKADGTIAIPVYVAVKDTTAAQTRHSYFAALTYTPTMGVDGQYGTTDWVFTMVPLLASAADDYTEGAVAELQDGRLLAVVRGEVRGASAPDPRLNYAILGPGGTETGLISFADKAGCPVNGVLPQLTRLANGTLVLGSGRPDNFVAIATDETGKVWSHETNTWTNRASGSGSNWTYGSSGYTSLEPVAGNQVLDFVDNCQGPNGGRKNGCAGAYTYTTNNVYRIESRTVDVLPAETGRIDIAGRLRHGTAHLTTNMTSASPAKVTGPTTPYGSAPSAADATSTDYWSQAEGAVDGSTAFWSGALADGDGSYQLDLGRTYNLTKLGLALLPGAAVTARISTSADGVIFTPATLSYPSGVPAGAEAGLISTPGDRGTRFYGLNAAARWIRVETGGVPCAGIGVPGNCSMINELQLFSTTASVEDEVSIPRGFAETACARVTQPGNNLDPNHDSQYAIRLKDVGGTDDSYCDGDKVQGRLTYQGAGTKTARTFQAQVYPHQVTNSLLFDIDGARTSNGTTSLAYHFGISNDAAHHWMYDSGSGWVTFANGPAATIDRWTSIRVVASTTSATLYATDAQGAEVLVGALPKLGDPVGSISAYTVATNGSATFGDEIVLDDLSFE
ncbi:hypothetical protein [Actinoplanes sp. HUAS TT8]|uniref:hypothetical protein n=1 Tax=Actinoplanes sp. HUAS TT8 TaxID=3447453 RepID=UPI003F522BEC